MLSRRKFLQVSAAASAVALGSGCSEANPEPKWGAKAFRRPTRSRVAIVSAPRYDDSLAETMLQGLRLFDLRIDGKRVVLKPNLVELDPNGVVNTHPLVIGAAVAAFRTLGAREVIVAEGPGHRRDNQYLLNASGVGRMLRDAEVKYVDINHDAVRAVPLATGYTALGSLYMPETILDADLFVSMPKLKTHHWAGATLSMKNLFGTVPSAIYGWPKNVLHWEGIDNSILDINSTIQTPRFNIVDGITGMEGNGPIHGTAKHSGVLVFGGDPVAVDATCCRLMNLEPEKVEHLREAGNFMGNLADDRIEQLAERVETYKQDYAVIESFMHLKGTSLARTS